MAAVRERRFSAFSASSEESPRISDHEFGIASAPRWIRTTDLVLLLALSVVERPVVLAPFRRCARPGPQRRTRRQHAAIHRLRRALEPRLPRAQLARCNSAGHHACPTEPEGLDRLGPLLHEENRRVNGEL